MIKHKKKITLENKDISKDNIKLLTRFKMSLKAKNRKESTIYNYTKDIEQFLQFTQKDIIDITDEDINEYLVKFQYMGNSYNRLLRRYRVLSSFYSFLIDRKIIVEDVTSHIKIQDYQYNKYPLS